MKLSPLRYRLRTLLIVMALGPMALAGMWYAVNFWPRAAVSALLIALLVCLNAFLGSLINERRA